MTKYVLIEKEDLSTKQLNKSLSESLSHLPLYTATSYISDCFDVGTEFYVVEFENGTDTNVDCFDECCWRTKEEIKAMILLNRT